MWQASVPPPLHKPAEGVAEARARINPASSTSVMSTLAMALALSLRASITKVKNCAATSVRIFGSTLMPKLGAGPTATVTVYPLFDRSGSKSPLATWKGIVNGPASAGARRCRARSHGETRAALLPFSEASRECG